MQTLKMWLDDNRPAPVGWHWVRTATAAIELLRTRTVKVASLDHDLGGAPFVEKGPDGLSGTDVINCMEAESLWPRHVIVHSHNSERALVMKSVADRHTHAMYEPYSIKYFIACSQLAGSNKSLNEREN